MAKWRAYVLSDPQTNEIRYVGVTHQKTHVRLAGHIYASKKGRSHRATWIRSLLARGVRPILIVIEEGSDENWQEAERIWIAHYRSLGTRLVNATDGGEGTLWWNPSPEQRILAGQRAKIVHTGRKRSLEARENISRAQREWAGERKPRPPRSEETRARMSASQKGKKASEETKRRLSEVHRNPSEETRGKLRQALERRPFEQRNAFASNQRGVAKSDEHKKRIAEALKKSWARRKGQLHG